MFGGAYGGARMPNWPHWHRTPLPGIATTGLLRDKGGNLKGMWNNLTGICGKSKAVKENLFEKVEKVWGKLEGAFTRGILPSIFHNWSPTLQSR